MRKRRISIAAAAVVAFLAALALFRVNTGASMRGTLLLRLFRDARVGDHVTVCLPEPHARFAHQRGFVKKRFLSPCGTGVVLFKELAAGPGEHVSLLPHHAPKINGQPRGAAPSPVDSRGRLLDQALVHRVLTANECVVLGDHVRSWDSRYFGVVPCGVLEAVVIVR